MLSPTLIVMTDAQSTLTRATTASRKSTIASRNASLIKKNTGPLELRPSDILIERFNGTSILFIGSPEGVSDCGFVVSHGVEEL